MLIYNSLGKKLEEFKPLHDKKVGIYVCGPTVYGPDHLGHARTWIFFDWLRRFLVEKGYKVKYVQNITDVGHLIGDEEEGEDKIEKIAKESHKSPQEIARFYEQRYFQDLVALNILKPDFSPRATDFMKDIIDYIEKLIEQKHAYEKNGSVYFDVSTFKEYGKLSGRKIEEGKEDTRIKANPEKRNQADFALWKAADSSHLQTWLSPWGKGYPGWHIECSVMSERLLSQPFDIHGSASEHIFPHHENEIAQAKARFERPLAKYWIHGGMLLVGGQKMSKSKKNYITIEDILAKFDADTVKLAFMTTHYRKPFNWLAPRSPKGKAGEVRQSSMSDSDRSVGESTLKEAEKTRIKLVRAKEIAQPIKTGYPTEIDQALEQDFNVPKALSIILENISRFSRNDFAYVEKIFGLSLSSEIKLTLNQEDLFKERNRAREEGNYQKADQIRQELEKEGIMLEDGPTGTKFWKRI